MRCPTLTELPPPPLGKTGWPWSEESPQLPDTMPDGSPWPRISIVTPSYNQGQYIEETIRSVLLQGYPNVEYIVIDGGSTDNSVEIIRRYEPWLAYWVSEKDRGQSHAINKGFEHVTGEVIAWLNSDDTYLAHALQRVALANASGEKKIVAGSVQDVIEGSEGSRPGRLHVPTGITFESFVKFWEGRFTWHQPGIFLPTQIWRKVDGLDEALHYAMDYDLLCRALQCTSVEYVPDKLAQFRLHPRSKTVSQSLKMLAELKKTSARYWHLLPEIEPRACHTYVAEHLCRLAAAEILAGHYRIALAYLRTSLDLHARETFASFGKQFLAGLRRHVGSRVSTLVLSDGSNLTNKASLSGLQGNGADMKRPLNRAKQMRNYLMSWVAAFSWSRHLLNVLYARFTPPQREVFQREFAWIFRYRSARGRAGSWRVEFADRAISIPLASDQFWLDWDIALSVVGHDVEIKETYLALLNSCERPNLFIDIGANYGTHSLLFLVNDISTLSFEPNSSCHDYFKRLCEANQVTPRLEPVALGDRAGCVTLSYPRRHTWLGSTSIEVAEKLVLTHELVTETVERKTLDDYISDIGHRRTLIKIDTEGHELSVLQGAARTLQANRPFVIFECWNNAERVALFDFLDSSNYRLCQLPWSPDSEVRPLTSSQFLASPSVNFIAIPNEVR